jgi:hypothetical protein
VEPRPRTGGRLVDDHQSVCSDAAVTVARTPRELGHVCDRGAIRVSKEQEIVSERLHLDEADRWQVSFRRRWHLGHRCRNVGELTER